MSELKLVILDVDGTLVDSQDVILAAMRQAFDAEGREMPSRSEALGIVGLSLPEAMAVLAPGAGPAGQMALVESYKAAFLDLRARAGGEARAPLYPGARDAMETLDRSGYLMSIATGKARRGLTHFLDTHGLGQFFTGTQTADDAPSKPNPGMIHNCLAATGAEAAHAVMIGDTEFDMAMGRAAGCRTIGVSWGYHPRHRLVDGGAERIVDSFADLPGAVSEILAAP